MIKTNDYLSRLSRSSKTIYLTSFLTLALLIIPCSDLIRAFAQEGVIETVNVGDNPFGVGYNPGNGNMYVTNSNSNTVSVIDQNNDVVDTVGVGEWVQME